MKSKPGYKPVTFTVEICTFIKDDVNPNEVCFNIDMGAHPPHSINTGEEVGWATGYTTTNSYEDWINV